MSPDLPPESWAQIRHDYEHTDTPVEDICAEHGISSGTLRDRLRRWRWTRRRQPIPAEGPPPTPAPRFDHAAPYVSRVPQFETAARSLPAVPQIDPAAPVLAVAPQAALSQDASAPEDPALIVPRLQGAVARVLPAIEAIVVKLAAGSTHPREMERAARALASLTRTLRELNTLLSQHQKPAADDGPQSLAEYRADLARKIDAIIASRPRRAEDGAPPGEP